MSPVIAALHHGNLAPWQPSHISPCYPIQVIKAMFNPKSEELKVVLSVKWLHASKSS